MQSQRASRFRGKGLRVRGLTWLDVCHSGGAGSENDDSGVVCFEMKRLESGCCIG